MNIRGWVVIAGLAAVAACGSVSTSPDAAVCAGGLTECNGVCVDTDNDPAHCGGCGDACDDGFTCNGSGSCVLDCAAGLTDCGGTCVDTDTDDAHCGGCDSACDPGFACNGAGTCALVCEGTLIDCGGVCTDTDSDNAHCGECDNPCGVGTTCTGGDCVSVDPPVVYSEAFTTNVGAVAQCTSWEAFKDELVGNFSSVRISGTFDTVGLACDDPTLATQIAAALNTEGQIDVTCNGHRWTLCMRFGGELWLDPPVLCDGSNCPSPGYLVRPCIGSTNANWGGVNTATCPGPDQTMSVTFTR